MVAIVLNKNPKPNTPFIHGVELGDNQTAEAQRPEEAIVKIQAAAFNHRDVWILKGLYPGIKEGSVLGADGVGIVVKKGSSDSQVGQRVLINPGVNWDSDPRGPEGAFGILGLLPFAGTFADSVVIDGKELVPCPAHLSTAEAAALPLAGLTAYRTVFTKAKVQAGDHVLVTGIGGGVALFALQFCVAAGAHVYVTSSSPEKIKRAIELGAKGGINYKDDNCIAELKKLLGKNLLAAVIDGAGGPLFPQYAKVMKTGGIIAQYGQTASPKGVAFSMVQVLKNIDLVGSTMGSRAEFKEMVAFVDKHKIKPVVSNVFQGLSLESFDGAISTLVNGEQFGKVVIDLTDRQKL
ncbi:hypothetical protein VTP01DRAFT_10923 [Rhizomucor pusillus]|uniref:uncharacterized protein n=1 Tax=Rhizomucor pusillus TaxID=4840 RepID=UPI0037432A67